MTVAKHGSSSSEPRYFPARKLQNPKKSQYFPSKEKAKKTPNAHKHRCFGAFVPESAEALVHRLLEQLELLSAEELFTG